MALVCVHEVLTCRLLELDDIFARRDEVNE